jgi:hypothetical protein
MERRLSTELNFCARRPPCCRPGWVRDSAIRAAREAEIGLHMSEWLRSPGLRAPQ